MTKREVLTDEEIDLLPLPKDPDYDDKLRFARAIEQAVLAKLTADVELPPLPEPYDLRFDENEMKDYARQAIAAALARRAEKAEGCAHCTDPMFVGRKCKNCGREVEKAEPVAWSGDPSTQDYASIHPPTDTALLDAAEKLDNAIIDLMSCGDWSRNHPVRVAMRELRAALLAHGRKVS